MKSLPTNNWLKNYKKEEAIIVKKQKIKVPIILVTIILIRVKRRLKHMVKKSKNRFYMLNEWH
jgi:hypothetical protein